MANGRTTRRIEIPEILFQRLDEVAKRAEMPTSQLAGTWLFEELNRRSRMPGNAAEGFDLGDNPYRMAVRSYPRRNHTGGAHDE